MPQVRVTIFNDYKPLKMKKTKNHTCWFSRSEKSKMDLFRAVLGKDTQGTVPDLLYVMEHKAHQKGVSTPFTATVSSSR